jgi:hypothetical protein
MDIVINYFDPMDINYIKKKEKYCNIFYEENCNEIYYAIKSIIKFAPFIRTIFIIIDNQMPILLDLENYEKIKFIEIKDIIPICFYPTFFSDVIESYLHNIPNLSEIFIYSNDDMFFMDYIDIENIITKDNQLIMYNNFNYDQIYLKTSEYSKRIINTANLLYSKGYIDLINNHIHKFLRISS